MSNTKNYNTDKNRLTFASPHLHCILTQVLALNVRSTFLYHKIKQYMYTSVAVLGDKR